MRAFGLKIAQKTFGIDWSSDSRENCQNVVIFATISKWNAQLFLHNAKNSRSCNNLKNKLLMGRVNNRTWSNARRSSLYSIVFRCNLFPYSKFQGRCQSRGELIAIVIKFWGTWPYIFGFNSTDHPHAGYFKGEKKFFPSQSPLWFSFLRAHAWRAKLSLLKMICTVKPFFFRYLWSVRSKD